MQRRDLILASAGLLLPGVSRGVQPCPPPQISVSGGGTATTTCNIVTSGGGGSGTSYSTEFAVTESPLREGGKWVSPPQPSGVKWTNVVTNASIAGGIAYGTNGANDTYDDSYAKFVGFDFPSATSIEIKGIVYRNPSLSDWETHELELWFCIQDGVNGNDAFLKGYEVMFSSYGLSNMGKWLGAQDYSAIPVFPNAQSYYLRDGDEIKATLVGNVLSAYVNGTLLYRNTDNGLGGVAAYAIGRPGFGAFKRPTGQNDALGFRSLTIRAL